MSAEDVFQTAIRVAREGRKVRARDLLIKVVEDDRQNEMAWMWLLLGSISSSIFAA